MFKKILVANRGEIASRIIRACTELNIPSVAIYSEEDSTSLYVKKADEAYLVGPGPIEGYLNIHRIVDLAMRVGADAIHPGYGFLSENPALPDLCNKHGITFIGPPYKIIASMGNKVNARRTMKEVGIPVIPGSEEKISTLKEALQTAAELGYPVMIKASEGGGGRGIRIARNEKELKRFLPLARSESKAFFDSDEVFMEKYLESVHHIEFQILADSYGNIVHLGERDCSIQRRHQKLIEISPSLLLNEKMRGEMGNTALEAARAVGYSSVGTVEFLVDKNRKYYFLEMNTRLQVEHPVTEMVAGIDIVRKQIEISAGRPLDLSQKDILLRGYAIEVRINAEDPKNNFLPNSGKVTAYYSPGGIGVRIDGAIYKDYVIPPYYDSLLAKLTVHGMTWDEAVNRMRRSLKEFVIRGVKTTIPFHLRIVTHPDFISGNFDTTFIDSHQELAEFQEFRDPSDIIVAISTALCAYEGY